MKTSNVVFFALLNMLFFIALLCINVSIINTIFDKAFSVNENRPSPVAVIQKECPKSKKITATRVDVTGYSAEEKQTDSTPKITAFMKKVRIGRIAVSWDLLEMGWTPGKKVWIEGYGVFTIGDIMDRRWKKRLDIFFPSTELADEFGIKKSVLVVLIEE
jgi:3D (Asp-Asp-Asp) domain-containing protein